MKTTNLLFALLLISLLSTNIKAQFTDVLNSKVHWELKLVNSYYNGNNDFDGQSDPSIKNDVWIEREGFIKEFCATWDCSAPCTKNGTIYYYGTSEMNTKFAIKMQAFESDNEPECTYHRSDDHHFLGYAELRDNSREMSIVYPSVNNRPCHWNEKLGVLGTKKLFRSVSEWDQVWAQTWRYVSGANSNDPLKFGTISSEAKLDINSTNHVSTRGNKPLQYTNAVWYSFTLKEPSKVIITTNKGLTDYDNIIRLFKGDAQIDYGTWGKDVHSELRTSLCAGTYLVSVSGNESGDRGLFKLIIEAQPDEVAPIARCKSSINVSVNQVGNTILDFMDINNGSTDECSNVLYFSVSPATLDFSNVGANTVTLTVTNNSGYKSDCTCTVNAEDVTGVEEELLLQKFSIYPNPSKGIFNIELSDVDLVNDAFIEIMDITGQIIYASPASSMMSIDINSANNGVYLVRLVNGDVSALKRVSILK